MFTHKQIVGDLDITHRQLLYFTDKGIVEPTQRAAGRGSTHVYSEGGVAETRLAILLRDAGFTFERIKDVLDVYRALAEQVSTEMHLLIVDGDTACLSNEVPRAFVEKVGLVIDLTGLGAPLRTPGNGSSG
jgi:DNA-binding transcriptional MerR regulator